MRDSIHERGRLSVAPCTWSAASRAMLRDPRPERGQGSDVAAARDDLPPRVPSERGESPQRVPGRQARRLPPWQGGLHRIDA